MKNLLLLPVVLFSLLACQNNSDKAQNIIKKSIEVHGGKKFENFTAEFDFRKFHIKLMHNKG